MASSRSGPRDSVKHKPKGTFHGVSIDESGKPFVDDSLAPEIRISRKAPECWEFETQLGYRSASGDEFVVPHDKANFVSDLMSMPWPFAWLVPGTGKHIPAVLLHDGLVVTLGEDGDHGAWTHAGTAVTREQADYILREAMYSEGTTFLRRWLMWTGVMLGTMWATFTPRRYWRTMMLLYVLTIAIFGIGATMDFFDAGQELSGVDWLWNLPWMGNRAWYAEVLGGFGGAFGFAFVGPAVFLKKYKAPDPAKRHPDAPLSSVVTGRPFDRYCVGVIAGLWFTVLLHVTLLVVIVYGIYRSIDKAIDRRVNPQPTTA
jgi:hypothetical protein